MNRQDFDENVVDFIYGELDPSEQAAFLARLQEDASLESEALDMRRVGQVFRNRLPELTPPPALIEQVLARVEKPKKRFSWFRFEVGAFWRPALTGAFALLLTLGLVYEYKQHRDQPSVEVAKNFPIAAPSPLIANRGGDLNLQDLSLAMNQPRPLTAPAWRQPRFGNGLISFASYGNTAPAYEDSGNDEIYRLEQEAQYSVANFAHQQAMRMHALGDHQGAAEALAVLIKKYPNYPRILEALALRVGCLFEIGQLDKANQELGWLRQSSPELAQIVEQRWRR